LLELKKDDPIIAIPKDFSCPEKKISKEVRIEEMCCHGEAMGKLDDALDKNMMGRDISLTAKIIKDRERHIERIQFEERKSKIEEFSKTNVDLILKNKRIMSSVEISEMNAIERKCSENSNKKWILMNVPLINSLVVKRKQL
jgi:hypothetical protein